MKKAKKQPKTAQLEKILFIPDTHAPYQDKKAWKLMMTAAKDFAPYHTVIQGDFADFYAVSSHSKDPNRHFNLKNEIDETKKLLREVKALGAKNNQYVSGNHEDRLERYLKDKAPELYDFISIPDILDLKKIGFDYTPYKSTYKLGKLNCTHDAGSAGRTAHLKALDTFQHNVVIGHVHRMHYAVEGNAEGEKHCAASFGWLGDASEVDYMHKVKINRDWTLGFGIGYLEPKSGTVYLQPIPIINYTCVVEGKLYKV